MLQALAGPVEEALDLHRFLDGRLARLEERLHLLEQQRLPGRVVRREPVWTLPPPT